MADEEPRKVDIDTPLSVDAIYRLLNSSTQSGKPVYLEGAKLSGADLGGADLGGANLFEAKLDGADLRYANLNGANLSNAILVGSDLRGANYDADTKWPEGFDPQTAGAVLVGD